MVEISDIAKKIVGNIVNRVNGMDAYSNEKELYHALMTKVYLEGMKIKNDNPTETVEDIVNKFNEMNIKPYEDEIFKVLIGYVQVKNYESLMAELSELYLEGVRMQSENPNGEPYKIFESVAYGLAVDRVST